MRWSRIPVSPAACLVALATCAAVECQAEMTFHPSVEAARKAGGNERPVVLYFTATWCGWCRRLDSDVFPNEAAADAVAKFLWVKIDIDEKKEVAARYRVRGVPVFVVLGPQDDVRASRSGYLPPEKLVEFLDASLKTPERPILDEDAPLIALPAGDALVEALRNAKPDVVEIAVAQLSRADRSERTRVLDAFAESGNASWPELVRLMESERLAVRAAAGAALEHATRSGLTFHPFAPVERRESQIVRWTEWLRTKGVSVPPPTALAETPEPPTAATAELPEETLRKSKRSEPESPRGKSRRVKRAE